MSLSSTAVRVTAAAAAALVALVPAAPAQAVTNGTLNVTTALSSTLLVGLPSTMRAQLTTGGTAGITFTGTTPDVCTVSSTTPGTATVRALTAGDCSVTVTDTATGDELSFTSPALLQANLAWNPAPTSSMGVGTTQTLTTSTASSATVNVNAYPSSVCIVNGSVLTAVGAGTCTVTVMVQATSTHAASSLSTQVRVLNLLTPTLTWTSTPPSTLGLNDFAGLAARSNSGARGVAVSDTPDVCQVSNGIVLPQAEGLCTVAVEFPATSRYASGRVTADITIVDAPTSFVTEFRMSTSVRSLPRSITTRLSREASVLAGQNVEGDIAVPYMNDRTFTAARNTAHLIRNYLTSIGVQDLNITLQQVSRAADMRWVTVNGQVVDTRFPNLMWWEVPASDLMVGQSASILAEGNSPTPVTYTSSTPAVCSVSAGVVTAMATGTCLVQASVPATDRFSSDVIEWDLQVLGSRQVDLSLSMGGYRLNRNQLAEVASVTGLFAGAAVEGTVTVRSNSPASSRAALRRAQAVVDAFTAQGVTGLTVVEAGVDTSLSRRDQILSTRKVDISVHSI